MRSEEATEALGGNFKQRAMRGGPTVLVLLTFFTSQTIDMRMQSQIQNLTTTTWTARTAFDLASEAIHLDRDWGKKGESLHWQDENGSFARIRFRLPKGAKPSEAPETVLFGASVPDDISEWDETYDSVNNLGGTSSAVGYDGIIVPPNSILVVAVAEYRGKKQVAYQIYNGSPQPYSLGAEGSLKVTGKTVVAGLESLEKAAELPADPDQADQSKWLEAGLVSNADGSDAIVLDGDIDIVGSVEAVGQIQRGSQVNITGEEKPGSKRQDFPTINFDEWDPKGNPSDPSDDRATLVERSDSIVADAVKNPLYGFQRFSGDVHFPDGLKLDGSAIYVDGNVTFDGPVEGSGVIIARGNVTLNAGANMKADVMAAILAEGDLTVTGSTGAPSTFQGLLYSTGDLTLTKSRTIGTAISASDASGQPGTLKVEDSSVIATPDTSDFQIVVEKYGPPKLTGQAALSAAGGNTKGGKGWEILEPNPADLLVDDTFVFNEKLLKILIKHPDGTSTVIENPGEAIAAGFSGDFGALESAYNTQRNEIWPGRITQLNNQKKDKLIDILNFDLNEFLKVSSQLKARQIFYVD